MGTVEGGDAGHDIVLSDDHVDTDDHWVNWTAIHEIWGEHHATLLPRIVSSSPPLLLQAAQLVHVHAFASYIALLLPHSARR
jgi:hypothetical protein